MDSKILVIVGGILAGLVVLVGGGIAVAVIVSDDPAPAPVAVATPTPTLPSTPVVPDDTFVIDVLEKTWETTSEQERDALCFLFNYDPDKAWEAFDSGAEHLVKRETFDYFFGGKCSGTY